MGTKDYQSCVAGGNLVLGISSANFSSVCGSSLYNGHVGSAAGSSKWTYALRGGVCPDRRRARRTVPALLEVAMQSAFQEKYWYTRAFRGLLDGGSVTVLWIRAFAMANEKGRGGVLVAVAAAFANSSAALLLLINAWINSRLG